MRLDAMGLGNVLANDVTPSDALKLSEALQGYLQLYSFIAAQIR